MPRREQGDNFWFRLVVLVMSAIATTLMVLVLVISVATVFCAASR